MGPEWNSLETNDMSKEVAGMSADASNLNRFIPPAQVIDVIAALKGWVTPRI